MVQADSEDMMEEFLGQKGSRLSSNPSVAKWRSRSIAVWLNRSSVTLYSAYMGKSSLISGVVQ